MAHESIFGSAIAGALIATAMFRTFVEKGLLTPEDAADVMNRAANALRDSAVAEERAAFHILQGLQRQLHSQRYVSQFTSGKARGSGHPIHSMLIGQRELFCSDLAHGQRRNLFQNAAGIFARGRASAAHVSLRATNGSRDRISRSPRANFDLRSRRLGRDFGGSLGLST
jgi:hypothetical protein